MPVTGRPHVAIVGCGFSGTSAFHQLVERGAASEITIFEASGDFGPGYAYRTAECPHYLINNTTDTMCLTPSSRRAFLDWLQTQPDFGPDMDPRGHLPRSVYGLFLKDVVARTRASAAAKGIAVNLVPSEVTTLERDAQGRVRIGWPGGGETSADAAILTTGRCPDRDPYPQPAGGSAARYFPSQVMAPELDEVPIDATVHVVGASLSAYDVVNRLFSPATGCRFERRDDGALVYRAGGNGRHAVLCSRSGRLKAMQSRFPTKLRRSRFTERALRERGQSGGLALEDIRELIDAEARDHAFAVDWPAVVDPYAGCASGVDVTRLAAELLESGIREATDRRGGNFLVNLFADAQIEVWDAFAARVLAPTAEEAYRRKAETAALVYAAPCPVPTAEKLLALIRAGALSVVKGVRDVRLADDGAAYVIEHEHGVETAAVVVNATGAVHRDVRDGAQPPLVRTLVEQGLLRPYSRGGVFLGGAQVDMRTFRLPGADNVYLANMHLWGPGFFTSSALMMATIVERIVDSLVSDGGAASG